MVNDWLCEESYHNMFLSVASAPACLQACWLLFGGIGLLTTRTGKRHPILEIFQIGKAVQRDRTEEAIIVELSSYSVLLYIAVLREWSGVGHARTTINHLFYRFVVMPYSSPTFPDLNLGEYSIQTYSTILDATIHQLGQTKIFLIYHCIE